MKARIGIGVFLILSSWILAVGRVAAHAGTVPDRSADQEAWREFSLRMDCLYTAEDWRRIQEYLDNPHGEDAVVSGIKNNLLDRLLEQPSLVTESEDLLLDLYRDQALSLMTRDYVLQHFAPCILRRVGGGKAKPGEEGLAMVAELRSAVWDGKGMLGGSALIGLEALKDCGVGVDGGEVGVLASHLAADEGRDAAVRATALQVAARLGRSEIRSTARKELRSDAPLCLRLSAVACLAAFGDATDRALLARQADGDPSAEVRRAAKAAVGDDGLRRGGMGR